MPNLRHRNNFNSLEVVDRVSETHFKWVKIQINSYTTFNNSINFSFLKVIYPPVIVFFISSSAMSMN